MVLGIRTKSRKSTAVRCDYSVHVKEIKPWPPSESLRSAQSVLLQWENGDEGSGSLTSSVGDGKIEFSESFRLPVTLYQESSRKGTARDSFQKNVLQFNLYEHRKDKGAKGQFLGSAVINLADYGAIKETITVSCPISFKRSSRNMVQSVLHVNIQPFDKDSSSSSTKDSSSKQVSLDKDGSESVYESMNEGNDEETEIASFTDDDDDDVASHSSLATTSSALDPSGGLHGKNDKIRSESVKDDIGRVEITLSSAAVHSNLGVNSVVEGLGHVKGSSRPLPAKEGIGRVETAVPSDGLHSSLGVHPVAVGLRRVNGSSTPLPMKDEIGRVETTLSSACLDSNSGVTSVVEGLRQVNGSSESLPSKNVFSKVQNPEGRVTFLDMCEKVDVNSNQTNYNDPPMNREDGKAWKDAENNAEESLTDNFHIKTKEEKEQQGNGQGRRTAQGNGHGRHMVDVKKHPPEDTFLHESPKDALRRQVNFRNNSLASSRATSVVQGPSTRSDRLKKLKSVQSNFDSANDSSGLLEKSHFMSKANDIPKDIPDAAKGDAPISREETVNSFSNDKAELESKIEMLEEELESKIDSAKSTGLLKENHSTSKANIIPKEIPNAAKGDALIKREETSNSFSNNKAEFESKIEMLEEELKEAAAMEVSLYSIVAEHGSSPNKVHAPARRVSRFYVHACKASSQAKRANAARAALSGLVMVSKACGNDVPRLTFWLSNSIVLRAIVNQAVREMQLSAGQCFSRNSRRSASGASSPQDEKESIPLESSDDWEDPQTFLVALEKFEAWIFSRIVESVWWQTLTPHMQSAAAKSSTLKKASTRRYGLSDQEQGNFSIELWKKAFKDACERLCPLRAGGHECGCLHMLSKLVMVQLVGRLDVAMFNAILRESAEEMPTDPVSDPISDPRVLPIPAGKSSFGAGVQLKNAIGTWSRWLTDLFGIDDNDCPEVDNEVDDDQNAGSEASFFKPFSLLNALSDLLMLPSEMLADKSTRKEVCPKFSTPLIMRVLDCFVPDEFSPKPVPETVFKALDEDQSEPEEGSITSFPCTATPTVYSPPSAASLAGIIGEIGNQTLQRSKSSVLKKSYTSDDELDELDSPLTLFMTENSRASPTTKAPNWMPNGMGGRKVVRYQLLREVWNNGEE
ncbi:hypothetical protein SLE2022_047530 [Rubroshorea leprosula]